MKTEACELFLNDPEANAAHLAECVECAALFGDNAVSYKSIGVRADALPLAPWEGATYKSWTLVVGLTLAVFCAAIALFMVAGVAPINGIMHAIRSTIPSFTTLQLLLRYLSEGVQHAPAALQIAIGISFVIINTLLIVLLRRAPRGIDV